MNNSKSSSMHDEVAKVDFKKQFKELYNPPTKEAAIVQVPDMQFLMVDGAGDPNTAQEYQDAIEALYSVAYGLKFQIKKEQALDYAVMPLEGLWWTPDMRTFNIDNKENWLWTMMIMQPEAVTVELFEHIIEQVQKKKNLPILSRMRLQRLHEGMAAQIMHLGPFSAEGSTVTRLHAFIQEQGYVFDGIEQKHHEIYLSDPRRAAPEKMKTVIRQPVVPSPTKQ